MKSSNVKSHLKSLALAVASVLVAIRAGGCGTMVNSTPPAPSNLTNGQTFSSNQWMNIARPRAEEIVQSLTLYGTYYFIPTYPYLSSGIPVKDADGNLLGPRLAQNGFCRAGVEGSFHSTP